MSDDIFEHELKCERKYIANFCIHCLISKIIRSVIKRLVNLIVPRAFAGFEATWICQGILKIDKKLRESQGTIDFYSNKTNICCVIFWKKTSQNMKEICEWYLLYFPSEELH